jgi:hypothetical protein
MYQTEDQEIEIGIICLRYQIEAIELLIWEIEADLKIQKEMEDMHNTHKKNRK